MKYYLRNPDTQAITGPFELDDIEAKLKAGELPADTRATGDIGESLGQVRSTPAEDWMPVQSVPGFGLERAPESVPLAAADGIRFCPGCAHQLPTPLAPGEAGVCERCGRTLGVVPPPPPTLPTVKLLPTGESKSSGPPGGCLSAFGTALATILLFLLGGLVAAGIILSLLANLLFSNCRA